MKKLFLILIPLLFISCDAMPIEADNEYAFPVVDISSFIQDDKYYIPNNATALQVFNLFYSVYGYGNYRINGKAKHTETAVLLGNTHTEEISSNIVNVNIYRISEVNPSVSAYYVELTNENNETITYCYKWQYKINNSWKNDKTGSWCNLSAWDITIYK
jgi:hypothetical protein